MPALQLGSQLTAFFSGPQPSTDGKMKESSLLLLHVTETEQTGMPGSLERMPVVAVKWYKAHQFGGQLGIRFSLFYVLRRAISVKHAHSR